MWISWAGECPMFLTVTKKTEGGASIFKKSQTWASPMCMWRLLQSHCSLEPRSLTGYKLPVRSIPEKISQNGVYHDGNNTDQFNRSFPPWSIWIPALVGLIVAWWGWHNIRNGRRLISAIFAFISGMVLLGCEFFHFIQWSQ
jgi:hypothetical protein